jgi:hypothetical protein
LILDVILSFSLSRTPISDEETLLLCLKKGVIHYALPAFLLVYDALSEYTVREEGKSWLERDIVREK